MSEAENVKELCIKSILDIRSYTNEEDPRVLHELLEHRLKSIYKLVEPYISAEQREDDAIMAQNVELSKRVVQDTELQPHAAFETEPGLSGHELKAFEEQKFNDTLGEDPKH